MEQTSLVKLNYVDGPKYLHIYAQDVIFWVDGVEKIFRSPYHSNVLACLAANHPKTVSSNQLFSSLKKISAVGSVDSAQSTVHKYIHGTRQDLNKAGLLMDVIRNVRTRGYRLAEGWTIDCRVKASADFVEIELGELKRLVTRSIEHMKTLPIVVNSGGLMYVECDSAFQRETLVLLDRIGWQLVHSLSRPEFIPDVIHIKKDLNTLMSYVLFWRVGHRLTEVNWRQDYMDEIKKILGDIEMRIDKIKNLAVELDTETQPYLGLTGTLNE